MKLHLLISGGALVAAIVISASNGSVYGSVPSAKTVTNDAALAARLTEIRIPVERDPDFDSDIARLAALEPKYQESLPSLTRQFGPHARLNQALQRQAKQKYVKRK